MSRAEVHSSQGLYVIDAATGYVLERQLDMEPGADPSYLSVTRFDLDEWQRYWGEPLATDYDILDLGFWYGEDGETYEAPVLDWRDDVKADAATAVR